MFLVRLRCDPLEVKSCLRLWTTGHEPIQPINNLLEVNDNQKHDVTVRIDAKESLVSVDGQTKSQIHARESIVDKDVDIEVKIVLGYISGKTIHLDHLQMAKATVQDNFSKGPSFKKHLCSFTKR